MTTPAPPEPAALGAALAGAAELLRAGANLSRDEALHLIALLSDQLNGPGREFLAALGPVLDRADAGLTIKERLEQIAGEIADRDAEMIRRRDAYERYRGRTAELRAREEEAERLRAGIADLERQDRLATHLPELRKHREELEKRLDAFAQEAADEETIIAATAHAIVELEPELTELLTARTRELIARRRDIAQTTALVKSEWQTAAAAVDRVQRENDELEARIRAADERRTELQRTISARAQALHRYAAADRDLFGGLDKDGENPGLDAARQAAEELLGEAEERLGRVDAALRTMLTVLAAQRTDQHEELRFGDQGET
jgi:DNA repair exonuclease SbcCD ATPase subunit